jgi:hypothetical protein
MKADQGAIGVTIPSRQPWTATGIYLKTGERFTVSATGAASWRPRHRYVGPMGLPFNNYWCARAQYSGQLFTAPGLSCWSLIGHVGDMDVPFWIGKRFRLASPTTGQLYLGFNDNAYGDNSGRFYARVSISGRR